MTPSNSADTISARQLIHEHYQALKEAVEKTEIDNLSAIMDSKLGLLEHSLLHATDQLRGDAINGLHFLVKDIRSSVSKMRDLCGKADNYVFMVENPTDLIVANKAD